MQILLQQKESIRFILNNKISIARKSLYVLFLIDFLFVLLHFYSLTLPITDEGTKYLRLDMDFGYSEMFQYVKFIGISILLLILSFKLKEVFYFIWTCFFLFLFLDDAYALHEGLGGDLARFMGLTGMGGLRAQDLGELIFVGFIGLLFLISFAYYLLKGTTKTKIVTINYFLLIGVLLFFGIFVDMLHSFLVDMPGSGILTVVEDSGEMIAVSLLTWYTIYLFIAERRERYVVKTA